MIQMLTGSAQIVIPVLGQFKELEHIVRSACIVAIYNCTRLPGLADQSNFTYSTADLVIWTNVESNTIVIAA
ncbi:hypothetical protein VTN96DRAFT_8658 [Rasamsonia emersonii]